jgi:hypothetical protein
MKVFFDSFHFTGLTRLFHLRLLRSPVPHQPIGRLWLLSLFAQGNLNVLLIFSGIRLVSTIVNEFQRRFEILWISTLATRDRRIRASVPRSINKPFPRRVEVRLCPLGRCQLGARESPVKVV